MIFGDLGGLKLPDICHTGEEKPRKNLTQGTCPDRGSNPGPLRDRRACYHLAHCGGLDKFWFHWLNYWVSDLIPPPRYYCPLLWNERNSSCSVIVFVMEADTECMNSHLPLLWNERILSEGKRDLFNYFTRKPGIILWKYFFLSAPLINNEYMPTVLPLDDHIPFEDLKNKQGVHVVSLCKPSIMC